MVANKSQKDRAQLTRVGGKGQNDTGLTGIRFEDTQEIQVLQDKCQQSAHLFGMDRTILQGMQNRLLTTMSNSKRQGCAEADFMSGMVAEANVQMSRVENLLRRLDGTIALVCCASSLEVSSLTDAFLGQDDSGLPLPGQPREQ